MFRDVSGEGAVGDTCGAVDLRAGKALVMKGFDFGPIVDRSISAHERRDSVAGEWVSR
jgi:hypothetical protein